MSTSKTKSTKRALLCSIMSLVLCFAMLIGTTFAWFTDSVSSTGNKIQSGTLNIDMLVKDASGEYKSVKADKAAIFNYDKWEPGYTEVKNIMVSTDGNLALKYTLKITAKGEVSKLAEVIDVYYVASEIRVADRTLAGLNKIGTLKDVLDGVDGTIINDTLIPDSNTEDFATIALKMQETAGNDYQGLSIGDGFDLNLVATQYTYEEDSFDDQYDANAEYDAFVGSATEFTENLADGRTIVLSQDLALTNNLSINKNVTVVGSGDTTITTYPVYVGATNTVTFKNVNFDDTTGKVKASSVYGEGFKGTMVFDGCTFGDNNWESVQVTPKGDATIIFKNCTFTAETAMKRFIHIQPAASNTYQLNITIENCTFNGCENVNYSTSDKVSVIDLDYIAAGSTLTLGGCEFYNTDGTVAANAHAYFCKPAPSYAETYSYNNMYSMLTGAVQTYTVQ